MQTIDVDLGDPRTYVPGLPFETFDRLRREAPVSWHEPHGDRPGFWAVTNYEHVQTVNRDNILFSSHRGGTLLMLDQDEETLNQQRMMLLNMDPPMHTRYRLLVNKGFTPRMVGKLENDIRTRANEIIDAAAAKGEADFVTDIAAEMPLQVIAETIGIPQEDRRLVFDWSNRMVGSEDPEYQTGEVAMTAAMELYAYSHQLVQEKRGNPGDDIMTVLINAEVEGHTLSELELDMFFLLLCVAGNETTRNLISHGQLALFEHPDQDKLLKDDPSLINSAVEEMLRWGTPVMNFRRTASRDTELGGQQIKEGDRVMMFYISANRDEAVFDDPYTFDIRRTPNEHVAFGAGGPHFCLGANLARLEIRIMFEELAKRVPDMEQAGPAERLCSNFINGIKHLPVRFPSGARS